MKFTCADVATVVTGRLFVSVDRLYEIYNFLTGDNLYTHQLPRAFRFCSQAMSQQMSVRPAFYRRMKVNEPYITNKNYERYLSRWREKWGDSFEVEPIAGWLNVDPLTELETMVPKEKIIAVQP